MDKIQKLKDRGDALCQAGFLISTNLGTVNTYNSEQTDIGVEDEENVINFVRHSSLATFIHHFVVLTIIAIIGYCKPDAMSHWSSKCDFPLKPTDPTFYLVFGCVLFMGCYSLTAVLYRSQLVVQINAKKMKQNDEEQQNEEIPL